MKENGIIVMGDKEVHIRDLFFEVWEMGKVSHESITLDNLQVVFDYWLKEKLGLL